MNGVQLAGRTCGRATSTTSKTIPTLRMTIRLLTRADSLIPMTSTADISATMPTAGRLTIAPVRLSPGWAQPTAWAVTWAMVHNCVGGAGGPAGGREPRSEERRGGEEGGARGAADH